MLSCAASRAVGARAVASIDRHGREREHRQGQQVMIRPHFLIGMHGRQELGDLERASATDH